MDSLFVSCFSWWAVLCVVLGVLAGSPQFVLQFVERVGDVLHVVLLLCRGLAGLLVCLLIVFRSWLVSFFVCRSVIGSSSADSASSGPVVSSPDLDLIKFVGSARKSVVGRFVCDPRGREYTWC